MHLWGRLRFLVVLEAKQISYVITLGGIIFRTKVEVREWHKQALGPFLAEPPYGDPTPALSRLRTFPQECECREHRDDGIGLNVQRQIPHLKVVLLHYNLVPADVHDA